jgi:chloramphenicol O-acetyltransferase
MKTVDLAAWNRRRHYEFFRGYLNPFFNICFELDVTLFLERIRREERPFFLSFLHAVVKTANGIEAFRLRIRGEEVVIHDVAHPNFTLMTDAGVFRFFTAPFEADRDVFVRRTAAAMEEGKKTVYVGDEVGVDDLYYVSSMPWMSFTAIEHPVSGVKDDSVPRLTWGRYRPSEGRDVIPFSVAANHALMDGADVAAFAAALQNHLDVAA